MQTKEDVGVTSELVTLFDDTISDLNTYEGFIKGPVYGEEILTTRKLIIIQHYRIRGVLLRAGSGKKDGLGMSFMEIETKFHQKHIQFFEEDEIVFCLEQSNSQSRVIFPNMATECFLKC